MFLFPHLHTRFPNKPYGYRVLCSVLFCVVSACRAWLHSGGGGGGGGLLSPLQSPFCPASSVAVLTCNLARLVCMRSPRRCQKGMPAGCMCSDDCAANAIRSLMWAKSVSTVSVCDSQMGGL